MAEVVSAASWKLRTLLRTRRYCTNLGLIIIYKSHLLSFIEYRTPAIYHARRYILERLDAVRARFLRDAGVDEIAALVHYNLAPVRMRKGHSHA